MSLYRSRVTCTALYRLTISHRDNTKASDDEIGRNLLGLAKTRPDIFGELPFCLFVCLPLFRLPGSGV